MRRSIFVTLVSISVVILLIRFTFEPLANLFGFQVKSGIKITSLPEAVVAINGDEVGRTPYQDENLQVGEYNVKLTADQSVWQGRVTLNKGTLSVVNRELAPTIASSSGEILTLYPGKGVVITSTPGEASVEVDGKFYGKTPLSITDLISGEHSFLISHDSYLKRSIRASLPENLSLHINVDLAVSEADFTQITTPVVETLKEVTVKQTPVGYLNVRSKPSASGIKIGQVKPGDKLVLLEELSGWMKVRLPDAKEGYVSSQYVQK
ncbi:MAG: PEGA domain-containing protein [Armatimonadetes bacterium]|nr:MAG: PEGA domain-containing protein [Armatimonadota bacterium]